MTSHRYDVFSHNCRDFCSYAYKIALKYHPLKKVSKVMAEFMLKTTILADILYMGHLASLSFIRGKRTAMTGQ